MDGMRSLAEGQGSLAKPVAWRHRAKTGTVSRHGLEGKAPGLLDPALRPPELPAPRPSAAADGCVALIDPDTTYRKAMAACLRAKGFRVLEFAKVDAHCIPALVETRPDAALIDVGTAEEDSRLFLRELREAVPHLQLAVVSNRDDEGVEECLLAAGAADFFTRGRSSAIVIRRLKLLVNGARGVESPEGAEGGGGDEEVMQSGPLTLRLASHRALWAGRELPLTVTEFRIVRLLATAGERGASYRGIYDVVHGEGFTAGDGPDGFRTNVRSLIRRIRRKFRAVEPRFAAIENLPGRGYRWRRPPTVEALPARKPTPPRDRHREVEEWRAVR